MHEKERKKIVKRQFYMTYLSQTSDDKFIGNIQFSNKGKLRKKKINEIIEEVKRETQADQVVVLNIIRI